MKEFFIQNYINQMTKQDLKMLAINNNIFLNNEELDIAFYYLKNRWKEFLTNDTKIINELKQKISTNNFNKAYKIYLEKKYLLK